VQIWTSLSAVAARRCREDRCESTSIDHRDVMLGQKALQNCRGNDTFYTASAAEMPSDARVRSSSFARVHLRFVLPARSRKANQSEDRTS
jgi:hypothetical protein